jgi:putative endonuclease
MAESHELGHYAEKLAALVLARDGWTVLARNWRAQRCELDLVARKGSTVAFVEVRARSRPDFADAAASINAAKRRDVARAARVWIDRFGRPGDVYRFDAIAVTATGVGAPVVEHLADAWRPDA